MSTITSIVRTTWVGVVVAMLVGGCAISPRQEVEMGRDVAPEFEREFGGLYPNEEIQQYVHEIGMRLVPYTERTDLPWQFRVLDNEMVNAFALPGGFIYITSGLLFALQNEAQLAAILGHEAAHVAHRHSVEQLERQQRIRVGTLLLGWVAGGTAEDVAQIVAGLASLSYSREQEREADLSGLDYIARQGYDPRGMVQTMEILAEAAGRRPGPEFLSTHPAPDDRLEYLTRRIERRYADLVPEGRTGEEEFRQRVLRHAPGR